MNKKQKKILIIIAAIIIEIAITITLIEELDIIPKSQPTQSNSNTSYIIENYDIKVEVNKNRKHYVTETIDVHYTDSNSSLYIPLTNIANAENTEISDIEVNTNYEVINSKNNKYIKIEDENINDNSTKRYIIKYNTLYQNDKNKEKDIFSFELIKSNLFSKVSNVTFEIIMPEKIENTNQITAQYKDSHYANNNITDIKISDNKISGTKEGIMLENQNSTIQIELPDQYFEEDILIQQLTPVIILVIIANIIYTAIILRKKIKILKQNKTKQYHITTKKKL